MSKIQVPTPPPIPSPSDGPYSLSERINIATRPVHSQLNRLILLRLPLALPPHTTNSSTYVSGLLHIAPIYITFESLWESLLSTPRLPTNLPSSIPHTLLLDACTPGQPLIDSRSVPILPITEDRPPLIHTPKVCSRTHSLLAHLRLPGLLRAGRLRADIRVLTGTPEHRIHEQLEAVSNNGRLAAFLAHTRKSVDANPHVLLAYAWVLYMALFSGGRYLRASLKEAGGLGPDFWERDASPVRPYAVTRRRGSKSDGRGDVLTDPEDMSGHAEEEFRSSSRRKTRSETSAQATVPGLQFFNFIGSEDGEDIKLEFKKRITEAEVLLTTGEKEDIITEAQKIFEFMVEMVGELDAVMETKPESLEIAKIRMGGLRNGGLVGARNSVAVARERGIDRRESDISSSQNSAGKDIMNASLTTRKSSIVDCVVACAERIVHFRGPFPTLQDSSAVASPHPFIGGGSGKSCPASQFYQQESQPSVGAMGTDFRKADREGLVEILKGLMTFGPMTVLVVMFCAWFHLR